MSNHHKKPNRDEMQISIEDKLDDFIKRSREMRETRKERFGHIDQFRMVRDQAIILDSLGSTAKSLMLAAAIDRLAQLPDFDPISDLEALFALDLNTNTDPQEDSSE